MKPSLSSRAPVSPNMSLRSFVPISACLSSPRDAIPFVLCGSKNWRKKYWMLERKLNTSGSKCWNFGVLYKSRCDNCLNEITERASADRREAGNLASKKELLTGMRIGINLKTKDSLVSRSSLLMCQMSWHLQNRNHHQFRKKKLPQLRVQQLLIHLKLMLSQKSLKVRMPRLLKMEQHMIKMRTSQQKVLRTVHLPAVLLEAHLENFQILTMERRQTQMPHPVIRNLKGIFLTMVTKVPMNQHGGHLTLMMTLTRCGVSMQLVPPRIWIGRLIRITTFLALGSSGLNPIRTGSSQGGGFSQKSRPFTFDDSLPSTPFSAFDSGYSPPRYKDSSEPSFDTFSRFDSFRSRQDTGFFPQLETLGRFDSMRSSRDFDRGNGFPTFDDIPDPFGSSAPFGSLLDSQTPRRDSDPFGSSGPFRTLLDSQTPRRDSDPFGSSGPFRTSLETPRKD